MLKSRRLIASAAVIATLFMCASIARAQSWSDIEEASPDAKSPPPDLAGHWAGSIDDGGLGSGDLTLDITQVKSKFGGTWDIIGHVSGTIEAGTVNGNKGTVKFKFKFNGPCAPKAVATLSNGNTTMSGSYFAKNKHCKASGTFTVSLAP
jgi:hypothetical protein